MAEEQTFPNVIELNVGGTNITTSLSTLTKYPDSMLATMFSGRQPLSKDRQGRYFIDCDGDIFKLILEYLRFGSLPPESSALKVYEYARYFCLQDLTDALKTYKTVHWFNDVSNIKETLKINDCFNVYVKMKCDIVSYACKMNFSPMAIYFATRASQEQQVCHHNLKSGDTFWYLSKTIHQLDWTKAMQYELDKEGIKCLISKEDSRPTCWRCHLYFNPISIHVSFNDCNK